MSSLTPLSRAKDNYSISNHTCQPMNILSINTAKLKKRIKVYGSMLPPANPKSRDVRKTLPPLLVSTSDQLMHFKHTKAQPWSPEWVEVRLCAMPAAKDEAVAWPSDLPDLNDERTQKLSTDEYSVLVPISKYDQLKALTKEPTAKIAVVLLHGKKYRATYRMPFPEEKAIEALKFK